nr:EOG090X05EE [Artemia franciscana]
MLIGVNGVVFLSCNNNAEEISLIMKILYISLIFLGTVFARKETLVLLDNSAIKETHSVFFKSLADQGHGLTFKIADDAGLVLSKYGDYLYDNLIIFAPGVEEFGGSIGVDTITKFVDDGGNILVAANHETTDTIRELATEFGFEIDEEGTSVIDHHSFDSNDKGHHTLIAVEPKNLIEAPMIVGSRHVHPLLYDGTGLVVDSENPLVLEVLTGDSTSYSYKPGTYVTEANYPSFVSRNRVIFAAKQAYWEWRVLEVGTCFFPSDFSRTSPSSRGAGGKKYNSSGNKAVSDAISRWVFKEEGVLRVGKINHHKAGEQHPPSAYTISEDVVYSIEIEKLEGDKWVPFNANDVQLEFVRIDPFVRTSLVKGPGSSFVAHFKIPDIYGVFQFKMEYAKVGYTFLKNVTQVSVRPLQHTQYERFITAAYPYYFSAFSMMAGVLVFSFAFTHLKDTKSKSD